MTSIRDHSFTWIHLSVMEIVHSAYSYFTEHRSTTYPWHMTPSLMNIHDFKIKVSIVPYLFHRRLVANLIGEDGLVLMAGANSCSSHYYEPSSPQQPPITYYLWQPNLCSSWQQLCYSCLSTNHFHPPGLCV